MCGRFTFHTPPDVLREYFGLDEEPHVATNYNITPSQGVQTVRVMNRLHEMVLLHWSLIPPWSKDARTTDRIIYARAETVADKPAYRMTFRK